MALDLFDKNPFATYTFGQLDTDRPGFTFDPNLREDFASWKSNFESSMPDFELNLHRPAFSSLIAASANLSGGGASGSNWMDAYGNVLMGMKSEGDKALGYGYGLKTAAAAGEFFSKILTYSMEKANADRRERNAQKSLENQMLAIDNQVQYYKNQIADKFGKTMARNAMTMAAKGLRVTAGNLLEQTKDAAYDATKDIQTLESNARLKKIALRSEARQASVARDLTKKLLASDLVSSAAKLGLVVGGGITAGAYSKMFSTGTESLNESVYGG